MRIQAAVFRIRNGPIGIAIKKEAQKTANTAFTDIKSVVSSQAQSIETM